MDKDRVEGKVKDVAGRVERQVGEWTGDKDAQVQGAAKRLAPGGILEEYIENC